MIVVIFIVILFIFINNDEQDEAIGHPQIVIISTSSRHIIMIMINNKDLLSLVSKVKPDTFTRLQLGVGREGHCEVTSLQFCDMWSRNVIDWDQDQFCF